MACICQFQLSRSAWTSFVTFATGNSPLNPTQSPSSLSHRIIAGPQSGKPSRKEAQECFLNDANQVHRLNQSGHEGTDRVVSRDLVVFGQDVVERLAQECAAGGRAIRLQLLASPFYEAVKREIGRT
jgi:hypothetical protein